MDDRKTSCGDFNKEPLLRCVDCVHDDEADCGHLSYRMRDDAEDFCGSCSPECLEACRAEMPRHNCVCDGMISPTGKPCSICGGDVFRVVLFGLPGRHCDRCGAMYGPALKAAMFTGWLTGVFGRTLDGWRFVRYERGGYWRAVWQELKGDR